MAAGEKQEKIAERLETSKPKSKGQLYSGGAHVISLHVPSDIGPLRSCRCCSANVQRCHSVFILGIDIGPFLDEQLDQFHVVPLGTGSRH